MSDEDLAIELIAVLDLMESQDAPACGLERKPSDQNQRGFPDAGEM